MVSKTIELTDAQPTADQALQVPIRQMRTLRLRLDLVREHP